MYQGLMRRTLHLLTRISNLQCRKTGYDFQRLNKTNIEFSSQFDENNFFYLWDWFAVPVWSAGYFDFSTCKYYRFDYVIAIAATELFHVELHVWWLTNFDDVIPCKLEHVTDSVYSYVSLKDLPKEMNGRISKSQFGCRSMRWSIRSVFITSWKYLFSKHTVQYTI